MEIWICGQLTGEWIGRGTPWEFQGAFTSEANAEAACRDEAYFIFPTTMDEALPYDAVDAPRARYPYLPNAEHQARCQASPECSCSQARCECRDPRTVWNGTRKQWICDDCGKPANAEAETSARSDDSSPSTCSASDRRNERKAYHVATIASSLVWGGEHGWERDEVGEYDLARALRKYIRDLKKQNAEVEFQGGSE